MLRPRPRWPWPWWLNTLNFIPQARQFDPWSGHTPGLWVQSAGGVWLRGNQSVFLSRIDVSLPLVLPPVSSPEHQNKFEICLKIKMPLLRIRSHPQNTAFQTSPTKCLLLKFQRGFWCQTPVLERICGAAICSNRIFCNLTLQNYYRIPSPPGCFVFREYSWHQLASKPLVSRLCKCRWICSLCTQGSAGLGAERMGAKLAFMCRLLCNHGWVCGFAL